MFRKDTNKLKHEKKNSEKKIALMNWLFYIYSNIFFLKK